MRYLKVTGIVRRNLTQCENKLNLSIIVLILQIFDFFTSVYEFEFFSPHFEFSMVSSFVE